MQMPFGWTTGGQQPAIIKLETKWHLCVGDVHHADGRRDRQRLHVPLNLLARLPLVIFFARNLVEVGGDIASVLVFALEQLDLRNKSGVS